MVFKFPTFSCYIGNLIQLFFGLMSITDISSINGCISILSFGFVVHVGARIWLPSILRQTALHYWHSVHHKLNSIVEKSLRKWQKNGSVNNKAIFRVRSSVLWNCRRHCKAMIHLLQIIIQLVHFGERDEKLQSVAKCAKCGPEMFLILPRKTMNIFSKYCVAFYFSCFIWTKLDRFSKFW